jgi:hypothetical protein
MTRSSSDEIVSPIVCCWTRLIGGDPFFRGNLNRGGEPCASQTRPDIPIR